MFDLPCDEMVDEMLILVYYAKKRNAEKKLRLGKIWLWKIEPTSQHYTHKTKIANYANKTLRAHFLLRLAQNITTN